MDLGLEGKAAVVLSSSRGLGLGIARGLAREGCRVLITGHDEAALAKASAKLSDATGRPVPFVSADLKTASGRAAIQHEADRHLGQVDILINNTGGPAPAFAEEVTAEQWHDYLDVLLVPVTEMTRYFLGGMVERGWGRIITVASSGIIAPIPNLSISNALRSSVNLWSKSLSERVAASGVTVNVLVPGRIHTDRVDSIDRQAAEKSGKSVSEIAAASQATIPMRRYGRVEEFAAGAVFLASAPASYITGTVLRIDGGLLRNA